MLKSSWHVVTALVLTLPLAAQTPPVLVSVTARQIQPGELVLLTIATAAPVEALHVRAFDRDLVPYKAGAATWRVLVGIDLDVEPGLHDVSIEAGPPIAAAVTHALTVTDRRFPTRRLTVAPQFVNPPPDVQARIEAEARLLDTVWQSSAAEPLWSGAFRQPVPQPANSAFGSRSVFNGEARSPHGGADFASPAGTPVRSPAAGRVRLARALYYTGNTVVVDHGTGLVSLFAHLSRMNVAEGASVPAGAVLGAVGATGRVTGPHLHWTVRAAGARVDPLSLLAVLGTGGRPVGNPPVTSHDGYAGIGHPSGSLKTSGRE
ncbi:MAG: M23 family metallopeptidase [Acidobacteria bacterium]|nr:M23 family metallopeptidase [Acidobacteriota bacterium]